MNVDPIGHSAKPDLQEQIAISKLLGSTFVRRYMFGDGTYHATRLAVALETEFPDADQAPEPFRTMRRQLDAYEESQRPAPGQTEIPKITDL